MIGDLAAADAEAFFRQHDDRASLGRLVGERSELRDLGEARRGHAFGADEFRRHAVAERDRAGLVERPSTTIERPSGVSSASEASCATSARRAVVTPLALMNSVAMRLPSVIVPVLSSSSVSTSPAASTARPLIARMFLRTSRSMPAMPIAERSPPIVVGIRQTSRSEEHTSELQSHSFISYA